MIQKTSRSCSQSCSLFKIEGNDPYKKYSTITALALSLLLTIGGVALLIVARADLSNFSYMNQLATIEGAILFASGVIGMVATAVLWRKYGQNAPPAVDANAIVAAASADDSLNLSTDVTAGSASPFPNGSFSLSPVIGDVTPDPRAFSPQSSARPVATAAPVTRPVVRGVDLSRFSNRGGTPPALTSDSKEREQVKVELEPNMTHVTTRKSRGGMGGSAHKRRSNSAPRRGGSTLNLNAPSDKSLDQGEITKLKGAALNALVGNLRKEQESFKLMWLTIEQLNDPAFDWALLNFEELDTILVGENYNIEKISPLTFNKLISRLSKPHLELVSSSQINAVTFDLNKFARDYPQKLTELFSFKLALNNGKLAALEETRFQIVIKHFCDQAKYMLRNLDQGNLDRINLKSLTLPQLTDLNRLSAHKLNKKRIADELALRQSTGATSKVNA